MKKCIITTVVPYPPNKIVYKCSLPFPLEMHVINPTPICKNQVSTDTILICVVPPPLYYTKTDNPNLQKLFSFSTFLFEGFPKVFLNMFTNLTHPLRGAQASYLTPL